MTRVSASLGWLTLLLVAGCGGAETEPQIEATLPTGITRFSELSPDFNADATDIDLTGAKAKPWIMNGLSRHVVEGGPPLRSLQVSLPENAAAGATYPVELRAGDDSNPAAFVSYAHLWEGPQTGGEFRFFSGVGGTVTVLARTEAGTTIRLNNVKLGPMPDFPWPQGSAELSGTIQAEFEELPEHMRPPTNASLIRTVVDAQ